MNPFASVLLFSLGIGLGFPPPPPQAPATGARTGNASAQEADDYQKRLASVREDIERLRGQLGAEEKREKTVLSELNRIAVNRRLIRRELDLLQIELENTRRNQEAVRKSVPLLRSGLEADRERLGRVLADLFRRGRFSLSRFALESRNLPDFIRERRALSRLALAQNRLIADYARRLTELGRADAEIQAREAEIADLLRDAQAKRLELDAEERKDKALVEEIRTNRQAYEQALEELNVRALELQKFLRDLDARPPTPLPFSGAAFPESKGRLAWPVDGRILQGFGLQKGSFSTATRNNGLEIAPPPGDAEIKAVHAGKVVFADFFPSYGNLIILDHGQTYYTLYGHCAEFLVQNGDSVLPGQAIAVTGDTASLVGLSLYFEIRYQTKPLDPLQWLKRR